MAEPRCQFGALAPLFVKWLAAACARVERTTARVNLDRRAAGLLSKDEIAAAENQSPCQHGIGR